MDAALGNPADNFPADAQVYAHFEKRGGRMVPLWQMVCLAILFSSLVCLHHLGVSLTHPPYFTPLVMYIMHEKMRGHVYIRVHA